MSKTKTYSDQERATIARMLKAGKSYKEIGEAIGRSNDSVQKQAVKMGYRHQWFVWTPELKERFKQLWREGASYTKIRKEIGIGDAGAKSAAKEFQLGDKPRGDQGNHWTEEEDQRLVNLLEAGEPIAKIAKQFENRSKKAVELRKRLVWVNSIAPEPVPMPKVADDTPLEFRQVYQQVLTQASTIEMVLFTLWKTPSHKRPISIEDAAVKLVRLAGRGPDFFYARRDWSLNSWLLYLAKLEEEDFV